MSEHSHERRATLEPVDGCPACIENLYKEANHDRPTVPMDTQPDGTIKCLDHGFVELVDCMGDDQAILQAARVSYQRDKQEPDEAKDRALIRYLYRNRHTTPFEMCEFKFHCQMPIFVARQWIRHRTASVNEVSARYTALPELFYVPEQEQIQYQSDVNKQGRSGVMDEGDMHQRVFQREAAGAFAMYKARLDNGMSKELARINLPLSAYTRWYWKIDLHNLLHFLSLRMDRHAQYEIRVFAEAMATFVKARCPLAWEAFEDFRLNAVTFSAVEMEVLSRMLKSSVGNPAAWKHEDTWPTKREGEEFVAKIAKLLK